MLERDEIFQRVRANGWHHARVLGGPAPAWSYTVGLSELVAGSPELLLAGGNHYTRTEINALVRELVEGAAALRLRAGQALETTAVGRVRLGAVHSSWVELLMLGTADYFGGRTFAAVQVLPTGGHRTMDVPDASRPYDPERERPWRWLVEQWPYEAPRSAYVLTDLEALHGAPVRSVHHHADQAQGSPWDMFAMTQHVLDDDLLRAAPLGVLIASDATLAIVDQLAPGLIATRDDQCDEWEVWTARYD